MLGNELILHRGKFSLSYKQSSILEPSICPFSGIKSQIGPYEIAIVRIWDYKMTLTRFNLILGYSVLK